MTNLAIDAGALLTALWMPTLFKILAADVAIGLIILPCYLWIKKQERCTAEQAERKWGSRHHHLHG
ncbi:hypothetical protein [Labrys neptuniae]